MFGSSFFHDYEPESFYASPLHSMFGGRPKTQSLACRFADINNNNRSYGNSPAAMQRQRELALNRHRAQQRAAHRRPVVYRPRPFEKTIDISDFDPEQVAIRFVDGELVIRSPGNVRYGFGVRRMMLERRVPLPGDVIEDEIQCQIDRYGQLRVTAPRKLATRYESDSEDDEKENDTEVAVPVSRTRQAPEVPSPRLAAEAQAQPSVPIGTKTDQVAAKKTAAAEKRVPKPRYEYTECDDDVTVEDEY